MMLNFVCYLDGIKHSGSTVRAAHPFLSLGREYLNPIADHSYYERLEATDRSPINNKWNKVFFIKPFLDC